MAVYVLSEGELGHRGANKSFTASNCNYSTREQKRVAEKDPDKPTCKTGNSGPSNVFFSNKKEA
jgi:hypothetical protein